MIRQCLCWRSSTALKGAKAQAASSSSSQTIIILTAANSRRLHVRLRLQCDAMGVLGRGLISSREQRERVGIVRIKQLARRKIDRPDDPERPSSRNVRVQTAELGRRQVEWRDAV